MIASWIKACVLSLRGKFSILFRWPVVRSVVVVLFGAVGLSEGMLSGVKRRLEAQKLRLTVRRESEYAAALDRMGGQVKKLAEDGYALIGEKKFEQMWMPVRIKRLFRPLSQATQAKMLEYLLK